MIISLSLFFIFKSSTTLIKELEPTNCDFVSIQMQIFQECETICGWNYCEDTCANTNDIYSTFSCNSTEQPSCTLSLSFFSFVLPSLSFSTRYHDFESMYGVVEVDMWHVPQNVFFGNKRMVARIQELCNRNRRLLQANISLRCFFFFFKWLSY